MDVDKLDPSEKKDASLAVIPEVDAEKKRSSPLMLLPLGQLPGADKMAQAGGGLTNQQDEASLFLFGNSFDTLSETAPLRDTFDCNPPPLSPVMRQPSSRHGIGEIALPDLKHDAESDYSLGDISPIKLVYSDCKQDASMMMVNMNLDPRNRFEGNINNSNSNSNHNMWMNNRQDESTVRTCISNPFYVLRSFRRVFEICGCRYLLVRGVALCPVNMSDYGQIRHYKGPSPGDAYGGVSMLEMKLAVRRVQAALCAFGGMARPQRPPQHPGSIFRLKDTTALIERRMYEQRLPGRYFLTGNRLSWEFEVNPPVTIPSEREEKARMGLDHPGRPASNSSNWFPSRGTLSGLSSHNNNNAMTPPNKNSSSPSVATSGASTEVANNKMKYRCKLCGQLKNNHNCPYRQPLQRSIGVMVYPAVNSFTAFEPGTIAPPLTKMNNFVSYDSDQGSPEPEHATRKWSQKASAVTPDSLAGAASGSFYHSPQSSLSAHSAEEGQAVASTTVSQTTRVIDNTTQSGENDSIQQKAPPPRKRSHMLMENKDSSNNNNSNNESLSSSSAKRALFVATVALRPEHYRAVTPSTKDYAVGGEEEGEEGESSSLMLAYNYPPVPLTFAERKRLSDTLFYLSKEIPNMTADCAAILREARANNEWDQAVAELLTQVVLALYCGEGDIRFEGLQQYLLGLGVSC